MLVKQQFSHFCHVARKTEAEGHLMYINSIRTHYPDVLNGQCGPRSCETRQQAPNSRIASTIARKFCGFT